MCTPMSRYSPLLMMTAGAVMISFSGVWVTMATVFPTVSAFYRVFFGGIILLAAAIWRREISWKGWGYLITGFICGLFLALDLYFWHASIKYIGPGLATLLGNFEVFLLAAIGFVFLGEKFTLRYALSIPLAFLGLILIVGMHWSQLTHLYKVGIYLGLITAFCYTGFLLTLRKLQAKQTGISLFYTIMLVSFTTALFLGSEVVRSGNSFSIPDTQSIVALLLLGLLSQCIGWIFITNALPRIRASFAGLILLLQPSLAFVWDVLFFQRTTSTLNWIGLVTVIAAIYLAMGSETASEN